MAVANSAVDQATGNAAEAPTELSTAELQARQTDRGMLVTLGDVLFEFGRAEIRPTALRAQGVDPARIETRGYGEAYPVANNASTSDRALNRRVEVYISNDNQTVRTRG